MSTISVLRWLNRCSSVFEPAEVSLLYTYYPILFYIIIYYPILLKDLLSFAELLKGFDVICRIFEGICVHLPNF